VDRVLFVCVSFAPVFLVILSEEGYPVFCPMDLPVASDEMNGILFLLVLSRVSVSEFCLSVRNVLDEPLNGASFSLL
jgi:hypothetical protein